MKSILEKLIAALLATTLVVSGSGVQTLAENGLLSEGALPGGASTQQGMVTVLGNGTNAEGDTSDPGTSSVINNDGIRYFPVTLYNYNGSGTLMDNELGAPLEGTAINAATRQQELQYQLQKFGVLQGLYFYEQELVSPGNLAGGLEGFRFYDYGHIFEIPAADRTLDSVYDPSTAGEPVFTKGTVPGTVSNISSTSVTFNPADAWGDNKTVVGFSGGFSGSKITAGGYFTMTYSGTKGAVMMALNGGEGKWWQLDAPVATMKNTDGDWVSVFTYEAFAGKYPGTSFADAYELQYDLTDANGTVTVKDISWHNHTAATEVWRGSAVMDANDNSGWLTNYTDPSGGSILEHLVENSSFFNLTGCFAVTYTGDAGALQVQWVGNYQAGDRRITNQPITLVNTVSLGNGTYVSYYKAFATRADDIYLFAFACTNNGSSTMTVTKIEWVDEHFLVDLDSNGGSAVSAVGSCCGTPITSLPTPTRDGFTFDGWYNNSQKVTDPTEIDTATPGSITLTARWIPVGSTETILDHYTAVTPDQIVAGQQYYLYNLRANQIMLGQVGSNADTLKGVGTIANITVTDDGIVDTAGYQMWYFEKENNGYVIKSAMPDDNGNALYLQLNNNALTLVTDRNTATRFQITPNDAETPDDKNDVTISYNGYYINDTAAAAQDNFNGYDDNTGDENAFYILEADDFYAAWNHWVGDSNYLDKNPNTGADYNDGPAKNPAPTDPNANPYYDENRIYNGLVASELVNGNIKFNVPEGGIFDSNTDVKDIYTSVGLPFIFDASKMSYTFDASLMSAHFKNSVPRSNYNLDYEINNPQTVQLLAENSAWLPFNSEVKLIPEEERDYHFGMRANFNFTMTDDGKLRVTDESGNIVPGEDIVFEFSGDDDVWIFIDGKLVLDLGGIHSEVRAQMNFAENTWALTDLADWTGAPHDIAPTYIDGSATSGVLFGENGILGSSLEAFAAEPSHELTIFYLERGKGDSNCHISFNLPMLDVVTVTKQVNYSLDIDALDEHIQANNINITTMSDVNETVKDLISQFRKDLTEEEKDQIKNIQFPFTLYKRDAAGNYQRVYKAPYYLLDEQSQVIGTYTTDDYGNFTLLNGQTARFIVENISTDSDGDAYYVQEIAREGFGLTRYYYYGVRTVSDGTTYVTDLQDNLQYSTVYDVPSTFHYKPAKDSILNSKAIQVIGDDRYEDSISFICENYLTKQDGANVIASDLRIVLDYGLPVEITPLEYAIFSNMADNIYAKITGFEFETAGYAYSDSMIGGTMGVYGAAAIATFNSSESTDDSADGFIADPTGQVITYQLVKEFTGIEIIEYTVKLYEKGVEGAADTEIGTSTARIYIMPATSVYYEDNFGRFTYNDATSTSWIDFSSYGGTNQVGEWNLWRTESFVSQTQEQGVVGMGYSPYGSDVAYLNDSWDTNETTTHVYTRYVNENGLSLRPVDVGKEVFEYGDNSYNLTSAAASFSYEFTGTGTTIYGRSTATSGYIRVTLTNKATGEVSVLNRDTIYAKGPTEEDTGFLYYGKGYIEDNSTYSIPLYNVDNLDYGTYTVKVDVLMPLRYKAQMLVYGYEFWLDGVRVYNPLGDPANLVTDKEGSNAHLDKDININGIWIAASSYAGDGEADNTTVEVRDKLLGDTAEADWNFVLFRDKDGNTVTDPNKFLETGPKNEVYLYDGQSISFTLKNWDITHNKVYIGIKAPKPDRDHTGTNRPRSYANAIINGSDPRTATTLEIENASDCYYALQPVITVEADGIYAHFEIKAGEGDLISITNIRVTGDADFVIIENDNSIADSDNDNTSGGTGGGTETPDPTPDPELTLIYDGGTDPFTTTDTLNHMAVYGYNPDANENYFDFSTLSVNDGAYIEVTYSGQDVFVVAKHNDTWNCNEGFNKTHSDPVDNGNGTYTVKFYVSSFTRFEISKLGELCVGSDTPGTTIHSITRYSGASSEAPGTGNSGSTDSGSNDSAVTSTEGFYVDGTQIMDAYGNPFVMRGVNIPHAWYRDDTETAISAAANLGANTVRIVLANGTKYDKTDSTQLQNIIDWCKQYQVVAVLELHDATGSNDTATLTNAVNYWIEMKDILNANQKYVIVNIANEWYGTWTGGSEWAEGYKMAIQSLRNAGIKNMLMVDCAGWGQEVWSMVNYGKSVFNVDSQKNTVFSIHMYNAAGHPDNVSDNFTRAINADIPFVIGEFGWKHSDVDDVDELAVMQLCEESDIGYLAWSWKGNSGGVEYLDLSNDWAGTNLTGEKLYLSMPPTVLRRPPKNARSIPTASLTNCWESEKYEKTI